MLDPDDETGSIRLRKYESPIPADEPDEPRKKSGTNALDKEPMVRLHRRLMGQYMRELDRQHDNRLEMAIDEDFYDNIQWREEDAAVLRERGQVPLVYNVISSAIDWVIGTEKRGRSDYKVLPRRKEEGKPAERKTQILKYLSDVNRTPFHRSRGFQDSVKVGLGWLEDAIGDDGEGEPIYSRYESWRNMLYDSLATEMDLSDARYIYRTKWVDSDFAYALFPKRKGLISRSVESVLNGARLDDYGDEAMDQAEEEATSGILTGYDPLLGYERERVRLIEAWFRAPAKMQRLSDGPFKGEIFDEYSAGHVESVNSGDAKIIEKVGMRVFVALMTAEGLLYYGPSPYRHNRYPFTAIWGKRRGRDGMPYGMIRGLRDIQEDINKRASKALHILSSNKVVMEKGAVDDIDELAEEVARPDPIIVLNTNKRFDMSVDRELSERHVMLMERSIAMIQQSSGVTDEQMGRTTNAHSGVAVKARQAQGAMTTTGYFDNLLFAAQQQGEKQLSLIEQFFSEKKAFRITNMRGAPDYVEVNDGLPENDIVRSKADYVISEADWRASMRQAAAAELMETMTRLPPEVAMVLLDLVVENMDLPNREEIVRRIRSITGQRDPDSDEITPEEQQRQQQAAKQAMLQEALAEAGLQKTLAEIQKLQANAQTLLAQAVKYNVASLGGPKRGAIDVAAQVMTAPDVAPVADGIMHEMGFTSTSEKTQAAEERAAQQQGAPPPQDTPSEPPGLTGAPQT